MVLQEQIGITKPIIAYHFALADLQASQTDTEIPVLGGVDGVYTAWDRGFLVGYSIGLSAAFTAGAVTVELVTAGVDTGIDISIDVAATTAYQGKFNYGDYPIAAGATIGATYTSDGSAAPTTNDLIMTLYVMYEEIRV